MAAEKSQAKEKKRNAADHDDNIDYWKVPDLKPEDCPHPFLEESDFKIIFPEYRAQYIQETWQAIKSILATQHLKVDLDLIKRQMTVATTGKTYDPFSIIAGRDMLKLIARGVPVSQAKRVLERKKICRRPISPTSADCFCDIIKIGGIVSNKERFVRRRQRLIGPNGSTLKVIEILTGCYVCVVGQTVNVLGPWKGLKKVRKIVLDCMQNVHPIYQLKTLMVQRQLEKDESRKNVSASRWHPALIHYRRTGAISFLTSVRPLPERSVRNLRRRQQL